MEDFCYFYRNTGYIVYNDKVLNSQNEIIHNKINSEMISAKDIYESNGRFYHKSYNLNGNNTRFLEWKQTRNKDWDWFMTEIVPSSFYPITKYTNIMIHLQDYKTDISKYIQKVSSRYNIDNSKIKNLIDEINIVIDKFEFD